MIIQQEQFQIPISSSSKSSIPSQAMITASKNSSHAKERGIFNKILSKYLNDYIKWAPSWAPSSGFSEISKEVIS